MWFDMQRAPLSWAPEAPITFENSAILDATPNEVFDILADTEQWARWFPEFEGARWLDERRGVGASREVQLDIIDAREEFLAWEPGVRFAFSMTAATLPLASRLVEDYQLNPLAGGRCQFDWFVYVEPRTALRPFKPVLKMQFGSMFETATRELAKYVRRVGYEARRASG